MPASIGRQSAPRAGGAVFQLGLRRCKRLSLDFHERVLRLVMVDRVYGRLYQPWSLGTWPVIDAWLRKQPNYFPVFEQTPSCYWRDVRWSNFLAYVKPALARDDLNNFPHNSTSYVDEGQTLPQPHCCASGTGLLPCLCPL
ncbi:hypothetical protein PSEUDO8Z_160318 [Pseudomonas sp. 8Z]|nr:hypothetical protein PSEUDO8Z_160318 [Pseudomonas sp. 8Z]